MARLSGKTGSLTLAGVGKLGATNIKWNPSRTLPDASGMDSAGYNQSVDGMAGATFTLSAHWDTAAAGSAPSIQTGGAVPFILKIDTPTTKSYSGNCRLSAVPVDVAHDGTVKYDVEATVEGAWVEGA